MIAAVAVLSAAVLAHEVCLLRLLSVAHWHHSAGLVVSVALLAFGVAGVLLARFPRLRCRGTVFLGAALYALLSAFSVRIAATVDFNVLEAGWRASQWLRLGALQIVFLLPFLAAATGIGAAFSAGAPPRVYAANMFGSGAGGFLAPYLLGVCAPEEALRWIVVVAALAAVPAPLPRSRIAALLIAGAVAWGGVGTLPMSPFKDLPALPNKTVVERRHTAAGRLDRVRSPALHVAPGLSLTSGETPGAQEGWFVDGQLAGVWDLDEPSYFRQTLFDLPYRVADWGGPELQLGIGPEMRRAALVVDPLLAAASAAASDPLFGRSHAYPRPYLERMHRPATFVVHHVAGGHAAAETPLLTLEGLRLALSRSEFGVVLGIALATPPRGELRLLLSAEAVTPHVIAARSFDRLLVWMRHVAPDEEELGRLRAFCDEHGFDVVRPLAMAPAAPLHERPVELVDPGPDYPFDVRPVTDAKPYFFQFFRWSRLGTVFDPDQIAFVPWTFVAGIVGFLQIVVLGFLLLAGPLVFSGAARAPAAPFLGLGAAFLLVEMAFLQKAIVRVGNPVDAAAAVMGGLLVGAGAGSLVGERLRRAFGAGCALAAVVAPLAFFFAFPRSPGAVALVCAVVALPMGMPFPAALARLSAASVPWALAWNGFASVAAAAGAPLLSCTFGIPATLLAGAVSYLAVSYGTWFKTP